MESVLSLSTVKRQYDLGVELGGIVDNQARTYTKRLWTDYVSRFGSGDSYGFSYAVARGRIAQQIAIYDQVGVRPSAYAIDVYAPPQSDPMDQALTYVYQEMQQAGEGAKPIIIQETYADDSEIARKILGGHYSPIDEYQYNDKEPIGVNLVFEHSQPVVGGRQWILNPDLVVALRLIKEGSNWVRPEEDFVVVARETVDSDGSHRLIETKREFRLDYLAARGLALRLSYYSCDRWPPRSY